MLDNNSTLNEGIAKNIHSVLVADKLTTSSYDTWKNNFLSNPAIQTNVYNYLVGKKYTQSDPGTWRKNVFSAPFTSPSIDYSKGLLGASQQNDSQSRRPNYYTYDPAHGELLSQGVNPFNVTVDEPLYQRANSISATKHQDLSKVPDEDLYKMIIRDRDAANSYYTKSQEQAKLRELNNAETSYATDKTGLADEDKFIGTVGLSGQPLKLNKSRDEEVATLKIQKDAVINGLANYYSEELVKRNSILNPKVASDPNLKTPDGSAKHAYMLGVMATYPLQPEKIKEYESSYSTTLGDLAKRGVRISGEDLSSRMVSDVNLGQLVAKGNMIEKSLSTAKVKGIDEGIKYYQEQKVKFDEQFAKADKLISENPQAKQNAAFMQAYNANKQNYQKLTEKILDLETEKKEILSVQDVQNIMVKSVAADYENLLQTTERYKKENENIGKMPIWSSVWLGQRLGFSGKLLAQRGAQGIYDFGGLLALTSSYVSGAEQEDLKKFAFASKSYEDQMRVQLNMPSKEEFEKQTRLAYVDPETDELKYNWASLPYFMVNTYLESMAMGKTGALIGGAGNSLLAKAGQFSGMSLAAEVLFGQQMLMSEIEKGTDFSTAYKIHLFRTALEGLTEMINPLEVRIAGNAESELLKLSTDEAETLLFRANHVKDYLAKTLNTRKWDEAVEWIYRTGAYAKRGSWEAVDSSFKEYLEEFMSNAGNVLIDKVASNSDPAYKQENEMSIRNEWLTFVNTVAGMPIMIGQSVYNKHKQAITSAEYEVSVNPEVYLTRLEQDYKAGRVNEKEYTAQKQRITELKALGSLSAPDYKRVDASLVDDGVKDNTKLLLYSHNKEMFEKSLALNKKISEGKSGEEVDKLSEELIKYQDQKEALLRDIEKYSPFDLSNPVKSLFEKARVKKINTNADKLFSPYTVSKISDVALLEDLKSEVSRLTDMEKSRESPNQSVLSKYESGLKAIDQRLGFLQSEKANQPSTTDTKQDNIEIIARKFVESKKGNTQTLTPEEEQLLSDNSEEVSKRADEILATEMPEPEASIKPGPATVSIGNQPISGRISKVYPDESFDFEFETTDGQTAIYPKLTKEYIYTEQSDQSLFGKYRVTQAGPSFEVVDTATGEVVGMGETFEEAASAARSKQDEDSKVIEDFQEEQNRIARKREKASAMQEALDDSDKALTNENTKTVALPKVGVVDSIEYVGKKLVDAFVSVANRMREYTVKRAVDYYYKEPLSDELDPKYSFIQSHTKYQPGTPVKFVVEENESYLQESKDQFRDLIDSLQKTSYLNPEDLNDDDFHSPIRIEDMDGNLLGYVHALAYIQDSNVASSVTDDENSEDNLLKNYNALKELRKNILSAHRKDPSQELVSTIIAKSAGHLSLAMRDEAGDNTYLPLQDRFKNKEVLDSLQIATAENIAKEGQTVQNNIASGRPIVILPMPNGKFMAAGLRRTKLTSEVSSSILLAIQLYRARSRRAEEIEEIASESGYDLSTIEGLHEYISSFVYVGSNRRAFVDPVTRTEPNMVNVPFIDFDRGDATIWFSLSRVFKKDDPINPFELQGDEETRDSRLNLNGIYRIKLDSAFDPTLALKQLDKVIQAMNINVDKAKLEAPEYESEPVGIPILELKGNTIGIKPNPEFANKGSDYKDFMSKHLSTNILEHEIVLPDGSKEFVYFEQSTIMVDPNVFLPKEPQVEPDGESVEKEEEVKKDEIDLQNTQELDTLADEIDFDDLGFGLPKVSKYKNPPVTSEDIEKLKQICNNK